MHSIIRILLKSNGLKWIQTRMPYHQFPNTEKILQGGLVSKTRKGIGSKYFLNSEFNCNYVTKVKLHVTTEVNIGHLV